MANRLYPIPDFTSTPPLYVTYTICPDSPAGKLLVGVNEHNRLCRIGFLSKATLHNTLAQWQKEWPKTKFIKKLYHSDEGQNPEEIQHKLSLVWDDAERKFSALCKKSLLLVGTEFQHAVWKQLLQIQAGQTLTYGELAQRLHKPNAARAIGNACGRNPVPLIVPCHRVVAAHGIGGFSSDMKIKEVLLRWERNKEIISTQ